MADKDNPLKGLWLAVAVLLAGMTTGFILLATVYTGPLWVKVLVFVVYIVVVLGLTGSLKKLKNSK